MFIVNYGDDDFVVQGQDAPNWDDVPLDKFAISVTLTDGRELAETLVGYDFYLVVYEAEAILRQTVTGNGDTLRVPLPPKVVKQKLYGIKNNTESKRRVRHIADELRRQMDGELAPFRGDLKANALLIRAKGVGAASIIRRAQKMLDDLDFEVTVVTLGLTKERMTRKELDQNMKASREGTPEPIGDSLDDDIRAGLLKDFPMIAVPEEDREDES